MKDKCMRMQVIAKEICSQNQDASVILMVSSHGKQFTHVVGGGIDLACSIAHMMHQAPGFDKIVKMAVDAYDNVPLK